MVLWDTTEEQRLIVETVRQMVKERVRPRAAEIDERGEFPWDTVELFAKHALLTPLVPERFGGPGLDYLTFVRIVEEVARGCASSALILMAQADGMLPILLGGSDELKERFLPRLVKGPVLAALAATEPWAGSDILSMRTQAKRQGDRYVINGQKCFITNGSVAEVISLYVFTDPTAKARGISAFVVEKDSPGLNYGKNENKMGMRGSINSELFLEDLEVPANNLIGEQDGGFPNLMEVLDSSRCFSAAQAVGLAQGALDEAVTYARGRIQFGAPISRLQAIQFMVADMTAAVEAARLMTYRAAMLFDEGPKALTTRYAAMAKCLASDMAMQVTTDAVQILGGYGYMKDYPVERMMRDAKLIQIYTGTNQIMRLVAGREILKG